MATLKQILDAVMGESGFLIPNQYANSQNPDDAQLLHLANAASDEIREMGLVQLHDSASIIMTSASSYALPEDFLAYVPDTAFNQSTPAQLPTTPQDWAYANATGVGGVQHRLRFIGDRVHVLDPVAGETISYEYLSAFPWKAGSVNKELATADTDEWRLDRRLLSLGVKWRWKKEKGLEDWQTDYQSYTRHLNALRGRNAGARALCFGAPIVAVPEPYTRLWV